MSWSNAEYKASIADTSGTVLDAVTEILDFIRPVIEGSETVLRVAGELLTLADTNAALVAALIDSVAGSLDDILATAPANVLLIPPIPPFAREPAVPQPLMTHLDQFASAVVVNKGGYKQLLADGGNAGVYRKFVESLFDVGDYARPQYQPDSYVACCMLVLGSSLYTNVMQDVTGLAELFQGLFPVPEDGYAIPVPQNVKARPLILQAPPEEAVSVAGFEVEDSALVRWTIVQPPAPAPTYSIRVRWDRPKIVTLDGRLDKIYGAVKTIEAVNIYLKYGGHIMPGEDLSKYLVTSVSTLSKTAGVFDAVNVRASLQLSSLVITDVKSTADAYVCVSFVTTIRVGEEIGTIYPSYNTLSNQVRINLSQQKGYDKFANGQVPDWIAVRNPLSLLPSVQNLAAELQQLIRTVGSTFTSYSSELLALADAAVVLMERLNAILVRLEAMLSRVRTPVLSFRSGAYVTAFTGKGGVPLLIKEVGRLLLDQSVENRPQFDSGYEHVTCLVLTAASHSAAEVERVMDLWKLIFNTDTTQGAFTVISALSGTAGAAGSVQQSPIDIQSGPSNTPASDVRSLGLSDTDGPC